MSKPTGFTIIEWNMGQENIVATRHAISAGTEIRLTDGRTVQVFVDSDGEIHLRAWGNIPILVGNADRVSFRARIECEEACYCECGSTLREVPDE